MDDGDGADRTSSHGTGGVRYGAILRFMGRKPVLLIAFWVLPLRILSYAFRSSPAAVVYLRGLDGIGAGIYGVAVAAVSADLTRGKGGCNTLMGLFATALAVGGVAGPLLSGLLVQHLGFQITFYSFAGLAAVGAAVFSWFVPETGRESQDMGGAKAGAV